MNMKSQFRVELTKPSSLNKPPMWWYQPCRVIRFEVRITLGMFLPSLAVVGLFLLNDEAMQA